MQCYHRSAAPGTAAAQLAAIANMINPEAAAAASLINPPAEATAAPVRQPGVMFSKGKPGVSHRHVEGANLCICAHLC